MKRQPETKNLEPRKFSDGETCRILRPHLWSGASGTVVSFANGQHRIRIEAKADGSTCQHFHCDAAGSVLESFL